ncbi:hypothetical protein CC85DRAFT_288619, partial [Cutaneotrichosporon oleaginosum]
MPGGEGKRAAPISASAFSFSLAKKPRAAAPAAPEPAPALAPAPPPPPKPKVKPEPPPPPPSGTTARSPVPTARPISSHLVTPTRPKAAALGLPSPPALSPKPSRRQIPLSALDASPYRPEALPRRESDVGVSPRKHKPLKGQAASTRLAHLVAGTHTSLVLFYTSLQQQQCVPGLRVRVVRVLHGPGGMALCTAGGGGGAGESMLLVLRALPPDCPRIGLDARALSEGHEVGVLAPWSESVMPDPEGEGDVRVVFASRYIVSVES